MVIVPGEMVAHKWLNPTAANPLSVAGGGGDGGGGGGGVAGIFPVTVSHVAGNDLNLGERWGLGCLQGRDQCVKQLGSLPALKIEKILNFNLRRR